FRSLPPAVLQTDAVWRLRLRSVRPAPGSERGFWAAKKPRSIPNIRRVSWPRPRMTRSILKICSTLPVGPTHRTAHSATARSPPGRRPGARTPAKRPATEWWSAGVGPPAGKRPGEGEVLAVLPNGRELVRYRGSTPFAGVTGTIEALSL